MWAKINALADRDPPLVRIEGPAERLPQWESTVELNDFSIKALLDSPQDRVSSIPGTGSVRPRRA